MSDLISRSDLLNEFNNKELEIIYKIPVDIDTVRIVHSAISIHKNLVIDIIKNHPTAYDIDKVVKELDKASDYYECEEQGREHVQMVDLTDAIEIVKDGGVSEDCCEKKIDGVNGGWIPVSERLPEYDEEFYMKNRSHRYYIVMCKDAYAPTIAYFSKEKTWHYDDFIKFNDVVAWQPLPEPYKESEVADETNY